LGLYLSRDKSIYELGLYLSRDKLKTKAESPHSLGLFMMTNAAIQNIGDPAGENIVIPTKVLNRRTSRLNRRI
jgi:hypothetical protein